MQPRVSEIVLSRLLLAERLVLQHVPQHPLTSMQLVSDLHEFVACCKADTCQASLVSAFEYRYVRPVAPAALSDTTAVRRTPVLSRMPGMLR